MPQSLVIGFLVLGGVLLLVAITGGKFKLFGAEIEGAIPSKTIRVMSGLLGTVFILISIGKSAGGGSPQPQTASDKQPPAVSVPASKTASDSGSGGSPADHPKPSSSTPPQTTAIPVGTADGGAASGAGSAEAKNPSEPSGVSSDEYAVVFDPPSNVRALPTTTSPVICSVTTKRAIRILGTEGTFYKTDICGAQVGYINRLQVRF